MSEYKIHHYEAKDSSKSYPKIEVTYFDLTGRAEAIREALFLAGVPFEDRRIAFAQWPGLKPSTKFGQLPFLTIDGKELAQTNAILIWIADLTKSVTEDTWAFAKLNELLLLGEDILATSFATAYEKDEEKKDANRAQCEKDLESRWLPYIDRQLHNTGKKFLLGDEISVADLALFENFNWLVHGFAKISTEPWSKFPAILKWQESVTEAVQPWKDAQKAHESA